MDPFTQGALGAALPQSVASSKQLRSAALVGAISGMAPDLDVLIQSSRDPLLFLEYHRQFTHALLFIPVGALICSIVLYPLVKNLSFKQTYLFCFLGYATHGLLDACTSYGTLLFWPLSDTRVAWHNVSVVDPLVTVPMIVLVATSIVRSNPIFARVALVWILGYLAAGVTQRERAETAGAEYAAQRGHAPVRLEAKPSFGNFLLWKVVYEANGRYYVDALRTGTRISFFPGESVEKLNIEHHFSDLNPMSQQAKDIERFRWFSSGYLAPDPHHANRIIDVRYSMMPNAIDALWSIELTPAAALNDHVGFITDRSGSAEKLPLLIEMILDN
ncbi:MAG TPA: metal-dependent hydrolase [Gammaproteobacteria bacterium]|nr:metal-dependent hydrolase [Gammaproteobacteria bacterium]|tara:strand:- start:1444 stop:2436 length:993 start_codon:yes stop_codon:yes gene_type:complete